MLRFTLVRLRDGLVVLLAVATLCFFLLHAAPGGPFDGEARIAPAVQRAIRARYHLDESVAAQYLRYLGGLVRGELGHSLTRPQSVAELIGAHAPVSAGLGLLALVFAVGLGGVTGVLAARRRGGAAQGMIDGGASLLALVGLALPAFVVAPILISIFALHLGWLPPARADGWTSYLLPAVSLGLVYAAVIARLARAGMREVLGEDFIRTARAKGASERSILWKHAARLGVVPVIAYLGPASAALIGGSFVVEKIFQLPGLGYSFVASIGDRDYPVMTGVFVFYAALVVVANLLADLAHAWLDPRLREGDGEEEREGDRSRAREMGAR